jgi:hypothetical protein
MTMPSYTTGSKSPHGQGLQVLKVIGALLSRNLPAYRDNDLRPPRSPPRLHALRTTYQDGTRGHALMKRLDI